MTHTRTGTASRRRLSLSRLLDRHPRLLVWGAALLALAVSYDLGFADLPEWLGGDVVHAADETIAEKVQEQTSGEHAAAHVDPVTPVLLAIILILFLAKTVGDLSERIGMPAVLGELTVGIILGNFAFLTGLVGMETHVLDAYFTLPTGPPAEIPAHWEELYYNTPAILKILAGIGVVLLLFEVGLESTVRDMLAVGVPSFVVAVLGVVAPMALGYLVGLWLIPDHGWQVHAFIGATLCATSVGITARVLKDIGKSQTREAQIILGAAVIDDVLGLVILAVVSGLISAGSFSPMVAVIVIAKALAFLVGAVVLGTFIFTRPLFKAASYLRGHGLLVTTALVMCFGFAWLAALMGLAPIVGAFAAGLILERAHYRELGGGGEHELEDALAPLTALLVPIFFVQMGTQVDLAGFAQPSVWGLALAITVAAIIGKQICSLGVWQKGLNRLAIGIGMVPRGEVGLIFAGVGKSLTVMEDGERVSVIDDTTFSAVVVMVMITTMVTPPLLKWTLTRGDNGDGSQETGTPDERPEEPER